MAGPSSEPGPRPGRGPGTGVPRRGWLEVRWRQFRRAPRPVVRAVASGLVVAGVVGGAYLAYDIALDRGAVLPGGDLRLLALVAYVMIVLLAGSVATWLLVPLPTGTGTGTRRASRTPWSAALGLFAALPIAYLVLVVLLEVVKPLLA